MKRVLVALVFTAACGGSADLSSNSAELSKRSRLIVAFKDKADRATVKRHGANVHHEFADLNAIAVDLDDTNRGQLEREANVDFVEEDPPRTASTLDSAQLTPSATNGLYGLVTTHAVDAHAAGFSGAGIIVGVADTGLDCSHPDIAGNLNWSKDFVSGDAATGSGCVGQSGIDPAVEEHATHVSGTILGVFNSVGVYGVAYSARLVHARVLGPNGGTTSDIMAGVQALVDGGARIINLSLGGGRASRTEQKFYDNLRKQRGVLVAAAAGNDSATKLSYPAAYASNISVGAVDKTNAHASFSNTGRGLDISAPGVAVLSSVPMGTGSEAAVNSGSASYSAIGMEFAGTTTANGVSGTLVNCGIGNPGDFPAGQSGYVALIQRGTLSFADKVTNAQNAGAAAVIIYNNVAGDLSGTLGAAGNWKPAVGVSDTAGAALLGQVGSSVTVLNQLSNWALFDGTSMATPHVAGALAVIWSKRPSASNTAVENALFSTATDLGAPGYDTTFGYGLIDVQAAANSL